MKKLLALNRGEIAIRILRAASELGLRTVAVHSQEDRLSLHRFKADEAYLIGEGKGPVQAYLDAEGIVAMAAEKGVDAIHPGYGFLSENPVLPRACEAAGIQFVGPSAELLELLGDKTAARRLAQKAGVPVIPGTERPVSSPDLARGIAKEIGFPMIVKAAFGGGGRGMRIVAGKREFEAKIAEAQQEAAAAFGNDAVFLERFIRRAKHIEVQILGDRHGKIIHLFERDCSVQRRHQKVVEVAPAVNLDSRIREQVCEAAVQIARAANYFSAGTVEFLVDVETGNFYFIEVNPRVQVEHTVTEVVTGIDIVRSQILVAQGHELHGPRMHLPRQEEIPLYGFALQCRVTTEDPANNFVPDYGKIHTYRSPAGFGIRLDGASAYGGAVITPYYDSLLVKVTSWGGDFKEACQRMDRALREFRIRGVRTNIPFLENVVNNPTFQLGEATTGFLDDTPQLFHFKPPLDRATKLLNYLAETIVNGNKEVAGKSKPANLRPAPLPRHDTSAPPPGTRQLLQQMGADGFAKWTRERNQLLLTDTTFRDAHQSLFATRMRSYDMLAIANYVSRKLHNLYSLEMWGGATFDVALRFLREDPWERLQRLREAIPNICFQMLLRASNAVGYTAYPDNVVEEFIFEAAARGIDIFRIFDSLNWLPNMKVSIEAARKSGKVCEAAICYTGNLLDPKRDKYPLNYYVTKARELERMGAQILAIKDMAGVCRPYAAEKLVRTLREETGLPIHFHTHDTSGINASSLLKASEAGVDVVDGATASLSGTTSQPNLNSLVAALANTERDSGLDLKSMNRCADYWEVVRQYYSPFDSSPKSGTAEVYLHEMPGGQYTNLKEQAEAMGLGHKWTEIARAYAEVNMAFGDIVKVTPSSKVVGDMAIFLVSHGTSIHELERLGANHTFTLPNSVVEMFSGALGEPDGGWPPKMVEAVLRGQKPKTGRPGEHLAPVNMEETAALLKEKIGNAASRTDLMSYLMYPQVFLAFAQERQLYGDVSVLPTPQFYYGMEPGEEITAELEPGKTLIIKFLAVGEPHPEGKRTVFFELNGQPREVTVQDKSLKAQKVERAKADPSNAGHVGAPIPGAITTIMVETGETVSKGDRLLVIEAMKMQTTIYSPVSGKVMEKRAKVGETVDAKDLLMVISTAT
ncbi:MAG TPA: pyruvate carboxylase [Terrimicrobiaceae bacterium]|nr:pyruvate carboxylase [Terrimicrobiaceae bacterium]